MNEYEGFYYYGIRIITILLGVCLVSLPFLPIEDKSGWFSILVPTIVISTFFICLTQKKCVSPKQKQDGEKNV